jgi:hypothetical protein
VVETRGGCSVTAVARSLVYRWEVGRLVITPEGDLVVKGAITNNGSNGEVRFGEVCLRTGGNGCSVCST